MLRSRVRISLCVLFLALASTALGGRIAAGATAWASAGLSGPAARSAAAAGIALQSMGQPSPLAVAVNPSSGEYEEYESINFLRRIAWRQNDLVAQWRLAWEYLDGGRTGGPDIIEGLVWAFLASANQQYFVFGRPEMAYPEDAEQKPTWWEMTVPREDPPSYHHDYFERAKQKARKKVDLITESQRAEIYDRVVYILTCREPRGFLMLSYLHDEFSVFHKYPEKAAEEAEQKLLRAIIPSPSRVEAWKYYVLAARHRDPLARARIQEFFETDKSDEILDRAEKLADEWMPPFEFYPTGRFADRKRRDRRYTDECPVTPRRRAAYVALQGQKRVPIVLQIGLTGLHYYKGALDNSYGPGTRKALKRWRMDFFFSETNRPGKDENEIFFDRHYLFPRHAVLTVKAAAMSGHPLSQCTLGKMYATGWGVPKNMERAHYWWIRARAQGHLHSILNLITYHKRMMEEDTEEERNARQWEIDELEDEASHGGGLNPSDHYWCANKLF